MQGKTKADVKLVLGAKKKEAEKCVDRSRIFYFSFFFSVSKTVEASNGLFLIK